MTYNQQIVAQSLPYPRPVEEYLNISTRVKNKVMEVKRLRWNLQWRVRKSTSNQGSIMGYRWTVQTSKLFNKKISNGVEHWTQTLPIIIGKGKLRTLPIVCVDKCIKADRWQRSTTQLYTVSQVLKNRLFNLCWTETMNTRLIHKLHQNVNMNHQLRYPDCEPKVIQKGFKTILKVLQIK